MPRIEFIADPFEPHPLMRNKHLQTVLGSWLRQEKNITYRRVRIETSDDDFLDIDFADVAGYSWEQLGDKAPIFLLFHGLEGDARRGYANDLYDAVATAGYRPVGLNFRSCSGVMNRQPRFYHMGATDDIAVVHKWLESQFPNVPFVMAGISLGANMLLKYLGENGENMRNRVQAAVAISPPIIATQEQPLNDTPIGRMYGRYLLRKLQEKIRLKADTLQNTKADTNKALKAKILREFDEAIIAPLHGFENAHDYYNKCHSVNFLSGIRVPTLLIRAMDDPFFTRNIPHDIIAENDCLYPVFPEHGGHVGFMEGLPFVNFTGWVQRQVIRFFKTLETES
jgi:hypothetical protein